MDTIIFAACLSATITAAVLFWLRIRSLKKMLVIKQHDLDKIIFDKHTLERQELIISNISNTIILQKDPKKVVESVLSEIHDMYKWPYVAYVPTDQVKMQTTSVGSLPPVVLADLPKAFGSYKGPSTKKTLRGLYWGVFPVGSEERQDGIIYAASNKPYTEETEQFFRIIASTLQLALEHKRHG